MSHKDTTTHDMPAIRLPHPKSILEGAKREAAKKRTRTKKSVSIKHETIKRIVKETLFGNENPDLIEVRTAFRIFLIYRT